MHARARAGMGRRVVDAGPTGEEYGASGGHAQGWLWTSAATEDGWDAGVLQARTGERGQRIDVAS